MKEFVSRYYQVVATGVYLLICHIREVKLENVAILAFMISYCIYREFQYGKGKILDKDQVLETQESQYQELVSKIEKINSEFVELDKEVVELRSKLSLATTRNTQVPTSVRF